MPAHDSFQDIIKKLNLQAHPEGGYYKEQYRSVETVAVEREKLVHTRSLMTSIYYCLEKGDFSGFHRLHSDELWYFHQGAPIHIIELTEEGAKDSLLGVHQEGVLEYCIPGKTWFAAAPDPEAEEAYSVVSCVVSPGFAFEDFELAERDSLCAQFPDQRDLICAYTRS